MGNNLALTIDFGTQSVRVCLFDKKGNVVAIEKEKYAPAYFSTERGFAEQDPAYYFECLAKASQRLCLNNADKLKNVVGLTMTCFRDSSVVADKNFNILRPCILWLDERRAELKEKIPGWLTALFNLIGMGPTIKLNRERTHAQWIKENQPEIWAKVDKYMNISTYFTYRLTGEYADSPACNSGHYPIDFSKGDWYKSDKHIKGRLFGIPRKLLCRLVKPGEVIGTITKECSKLTGLPVGLKVYSAGSDKSCETLGMGVLEKNIASVSYGTASTIELTDTKYSDAEPFLPSYPSCINGYFNKEIQVYRGYWMLTWFEKEFCHEASTESIENKITNTISLETLNKEMLNINPGSDGLVLQPYWGPGLRRPLARGAIIGFSDTHTRLHLYRAIIEGIAYALREGLEYLVKHRTHTKVEEIRISGGGSQSDAICQITADIFGLPVSRVQTFETSSLGAAVACFVATKDFDNAKDAINAMVHPGKRFEPNMENHKKYDYLFYKGYMKMYPNLKDIYKDLKNFK